MNENWIIKQREQFEALSPEEQEDKKQEAYDEAHRTKETIDNFVSPDNIIAGLDTEGMVRLDREFKNTNHKKTVVDNSEKIGKPFTTSYASEAYNSMLNDIKYNEGRQVEKLKKLFKNIPVIDIGAGENILGYNIARLLGAKGYIAIEPFNHEALQYEMTNLGHAEEVENIPFAIVPEDALTFLKRLPDHSVGVFTFGTDGFVLGWSPESGKDVSKYINEIRAEITRVLNPESAQIENNSDLIGSNLEQSADESLKTYVDFGNVDLRVLKPKIEK